MTVLPASRLTAVGDSSLSGSVGYRFSEENYFEPLRSVVSNGKLRASFGAIGNEAIGSQNLFISTIGSTTVDWIDPETGNKMSGFGIPSLVSKTLTWERVETLDLGIDLGFFNNTLSLGFDWYQRYTKDMLAPGEVKPGMLGVSAPKTNAGSLRTRGWELSVDYRNRFGEVDVYGNFNIGDYETYVMQWKNDTGILSSYYSGQRIGDIWGFETDRLFTKEDFTYDSEGNVTGRETTSNYAEAGYYKCGSAAPDLFGGFSTTLTWKGFDLNAVFGYSIGGKDL